MAPEPTIPVNKAVETREPLKVLDALVTDCLKAKEDMVRNGGDTRKKSRGTPAIYPEGKPWCYYSYKEGAGHWAAGAGLLKDICCKFSTSSD